MFAELTASNALSLASSLMAPTSARQLGGCALKTALLRLVERDCVSVCGLSENKEVGLPLDRGTLLFVFFFKTFIILKNKIKVKTIPVLLSSFALKQASRKKGGGGEIIEVFPYPGVGWCQDNGNRSNEQSKFDFLATHQCLVKIDEGQQKIKIVRTN